MLANQNQCLPKHLQQPKDEKKIEQVSEAFDAFKSNLNHIQSLSDFTSTFDSFKENLEKVENVSSEIITIKDEIKSLIKQEDLDSAMMAQLLFVEESISKIESKISSINGETVDQIKEDFKGDGWKWAKIEWVDDEMYTTSQKWKAKLRNKNEDHFIPKYYRCDDVQIINLNKTLKTLVKLKERS